MNDMLNWNILFLFYPCFIIIIIIIIIIVIIISFYSFRTALLNTEVFLLGELQLVAKGQQDVNLTCLRLSWVS